MSQIEKELKLDDAISAKTVPDIEKPYQIPVNWCWVYAPTVFEIEYGKGLSTKNLTQVGFPVFGANGQIGYYKEYMFEKPQALMSCRGAYSGTMNLSLPESYVTSNSLIISSPKIRMSPQFICYLFSSQDTKSLVSGTAQPQVTIQAFQEFPIPLIPLNEQQRIVDRIESLFTKLDEAKEKAQAVVDGFEDRKAAILHKAFTGELTEKWRCTHKHSSEEWNSIPFEECIDTMQNGIAKRKGTEGEPFIVIRLANLSDDSFIEDDLREIVLDEKEQHNYELHQDDVIMIRVNGSKENVGKQYRVTNQKKWAFCDHLIRIHYTANVVSQYMVYYSKTKQYRQYIMDNMVSSAGQNTISRKGLSRLQLPIPSIEEQKEIVSLLDTHFEKENQAIDTAKKVIDQIDTMKKTILARAFRGELGTNDPNDENAIELLKKVLSVEPTPQPRKKGVTLPKEISGELKTELERKIVKLFIQKETDSLPIKDLMSVSSKPFEVLETLHDLEKRQIIKRVENSSNTYELMR